MRNNELIRTCEYFAIDCSSVSRSCWHVSAFPDPWNSEVLPFAPMPLFERSQLSLNLTSVERRWTTIKNAQSKGAASSSTYLTSILRLQNSNLDLTERTYSSRCLTMKLLSYFCTTQHEEDDCQPVQLRENNAGFTRQPSDANLPSLPEQPRRRP